MKSRIGATLSHMCGTRSKSLCFLIISLLVGVVGFFAYSPTAYASDPNPLPIDANLVPVQVTEGTESITGRLRATALVFGGDIYYSLDNVNDIYELSSAPSSGSFEVLYEGTVTINQQYTDINAGSWYTYLYGNKSHTISFAYSGNSAGTSMRITLLDYEIDSNLELNSAFAQWSQSSSDQSSVSYYFSSIQQNVPSYFDLSITLHYQALCRFSFTSANCYNQIINALGTNLSPSKNTTTNNISVFQTEYNYLDTFQAIDYKLYQIWSANQDIISRINSLLIEAIDQGVTLDNIYIALGSIMVQISNFQNSNHTDIETLRQQLLASIANNLNIQTTSINNKIHQEIDRLIYELLYDERGYVDQNDAVREDYESANAIADAAVDQAVPSYEAALDEVENYAFNTFFSSQTSAVTFWRDVGEFILDSSNLGYIASGLIIVTIIGLFVYLLRL